MDYAEKNPPPKNQTRDDKIYVGEGDPGTIVGEVRLIKAWNALGHEVSDIQRIIYDLLIISRAQKIL
jgi:hypothetical protein